MKLGKCGQKSGRELEESLVVFKANNPKLAAHPDVCITFLIYVAQVSKTGRFEMATVPVSEKVMVFLVSTKCLTHVNQNDYFFETKCLI